MMVTDRSLKVHRVVSPVRTQVAENLRQAILGRHFKPGQRLVERELVEATGASRTSVREALRELAAEGLVTSIPNKGTVVTEVTRDEARQLYELRSGLEALAGRLFVERATDAEVDDLERAFEVIEESYRLGVGTLAAKDAFYDVLLEGAGNNEIHSILNSLQARVRMLRAASMSNPGRGPKIIKELDELVGAIERRDGDAAAAACARHLGRAEASGLKGISSYSPA